MPCPFTGPKNFCDGQKFLSKVKSLTAFIASSKTFVLAQKLNLLIENLLVWHKNFGPAQNSLRPFEGRGISTPIYDHFVTFVNCVLLKR